MAGTLIWIPGTLAAHWPRAGQTFPHNVGDGSHQAWVYVAWLHTLVGMGRAEPPASPQTLHLCGELRP